jgi:hypothetical protein
MTIKYRIDYQELSRGSARPSDDGEVAGIEATDETGSVIIPNVGDYVSIDNDGDGQGRPSFAGKVKSRLFRYMRVGETLWCIVNIVVEETEDDWGLLAKE